jgi:hypothetical protein
MRSTIRTIPRRAWWAIKRESPRASTRKEASTPTRQRRKTMRRLTKKMRRKKGKKDMRRRTKRRRLTTKKYMRRKRTKKRWTNGTKCPLGVSWVVAHLKESAESGGELSITWEGSSMVGSMGDFTEDDMDELVEEILRTVG